jgi:micrococcal nuclease
LSREQRIIVVVLGLAAVVVLCCLGCSLVISLLALLGHESAGPPGAIATVARASTPTATTPVSPVPTCTLRATAEPSPTHTPPMLPSPTLTPALTPTPSPTAVPTATPTPFPPTPTVTPPVTEAQVTRIIDGDTIEVALAGQTYRLRYIGIECPEAGQYGYEQATEANRQLVEGKTVRLEKDVSNTDQYGRLLRYVYVGEIFVNAELVRRGFATAWTYPPDVAYADFLVQLEREAREAGLGLWSSPTPTSGTGWTCVGNIYNCGDFSSCAEVMSYWNACPGDPSRLDGDHDGRPCESLCQ